MLDGSLPAHACTIPESVDTSGTGCCDALRTVGHCGGSEVKHDINTVQFLAQTDRFVSLDLDVSSRAAGIHLVLSKPWVPLTAIT